MADVYTKTGLRQYEAVCAPYTTETIEFVDGAANYFRVQNFGASRIFCGLTKMPTEANYDFACKGESVKMFAEPISRRYINIYNPSGTPVRVRVLAIAAEFDPLVLAFSEMELDFSGTTIETSTNITGFNSPLPSGTNKIGAVDVARQDEVISLLSTIADKLTDAESGEY